MNTNNHDFPQRYHRTVHIPLDVPTETALRQLIDHHRVEGLRLSRASVARKAILRLHEATFGPATGIGGAA